MRKQFHILNGDSLKEQFPEKIQGAIIITRECLVDGNVTGNNLDELFASRAKFLSENYGGTTQGYYKKVVPELHKILSIPDHSDIHLWFEDDLFCQVNFWFVINLLLKIEAKDNRVFLVRPDTHTQYGFGGLTKAQLLSILENKILLTELDKISSLWESYQNDTIEELKQIAQELEEKYPFIDTAVQAHIDRIPTSTNLGRPITTLVKIMEELQTKEFGRIFQEFTKREFIYGFGDLQVKRLYDDVITMEDK